MRKHVGLFGVAFAVLSACGGGGGGGGGGSSEPTAATPPAQSSANRQLAIGDQWIYDVVGTGDNGVTVTGTGTAKIFGDVVTPSGSRCAAYDLSLILNMLNAQRIIHARVYETQDAAGAVYDCGDNYNSRYGERFISNPGGVVMVLPGTLSLGLVYSYLANYTSGEWSDCSGRVDGYESVPTAAGTFNAYKVTETCEDSDQSNSVDEAWYNPDMYIVKERINVDGLSMTLTLKAFSAGTGTGTGGNARPAPATPQTGTVVITGPSV